MKIPKSIWVKGQEYQIKVIKGFIENHEAEGMTSQHDKTIELDAGIKGNKLKKLVLHEIGHAIQYETAISEALSTEMQEVITENFATVIIDLFHVRFK